MAAAKSNDAPKLANDLSAAARYVVARVPVGHNPQKVVLSPDGATLYVANRLDDNISVLDTARGAVTATISLGGPAELTQARRGERLFYSSKFCFRQSIRLCQLPPGRHYRWPAMGSGTGRFRRRHRGQSFARGIGDTAPYKWNGGNPDLQTECGPRTERFFFRSQGFRGSDLQDLAQYVKSIPLRPNRYRLPNGELTPAQERGKAIFERTAKKDGTPIPEPNQCFVCHSGPYYTNLQLDRRGNRKSHRPFARGSTFRNSPTWSTARPTFMTGPRVRSRKSGPCTIPDDKHGVSNDLTKDELNDLIEYLKTL